MEHHIYWKEYKFHLVIIQWPGILLFDAKRKTFLYYVLRNMDQVKSEHPTAVRNTGTLNSDCRLPSKLFQHFLPALENLMFFNEINVCELIKNTNRVTTYRVHDYRSAIKNSVIEKNLPMSKSV